MKNWFFLILLLSFSSLRSQTTNTVLEELQDGKTLQLEWVYQQYLADRESLPDDHPLLTHQLQDGEGELIIGLQLELDNCNQAPCKVNVMINYVSLVRFPDRKPFEPGLDLYHETTPPNASLFPFIEDSRYSESERNTKPLFVDIERGIITSDWDEHINESNELPVYYTQNNFQTFLTKLWSQKWLDKEHFQLTKQLKESTHSSVHFFRPNHPPRVTTLTGTILTASEEVSLHRLKEGSRLQSWQTETITLDDSHSFQTKVILDRAKMFTIMHGFNALVLYIEPGDSLHIDIDANAFYRNTTFSGDGVDNNQFLLDYYHQVREDNIFLTPDPNLLKQSQLDYFTNIQNKEKEELAFIANYPNKLEPSFSNYFTQFTRLQNASTIFENISWFYKQKDAKIEPAVLTYAQQVSKYLFRLPEDREYDFHLESYLRFQQLLLSGNYTNKSFPFRSNQNYDFAKMIFSPKNAFRYGRLLLFTNRGNDLSKSYKKLYNDVTSICRDEKELKTLADYKNPNIGNPTSSGLRSFATGRPAPLWSFKNGNKDSIQLKDYRGRYLLLHIGMEENLTQALKDMSDIRKESAQNFEVISLVSTVDSTKENQNQVVYLSYLEMKTLRKNYSIDDYANQFYIIDPEGVVISNPYFTSSFKKLKSAIKDLPIEEKTARWKPSEAFWRNLGLSSLLVLALGGIYVQRKRVLAKQEQQRRHLLELELKGIRSQMNPHFLFNALSSIQNLIRKNDGIGADRYLTQFAGLVRKILHNSEQEFITLEEEINALEQYCSLEALRTPFEYNITITDDIDPHNTYIPGMLLQPLIENAILHGLSPKADNRKLWLTIKKQNDELFCEIEDNGIGIKQASLKTSQDNFKRKSYGLALVKQRLKLLSDQSTAFLKIIDRSEREDQNGTIIQLIIPTEK